MGELGRPDEEESNGSHIDSLETTSGESRTSRWSKLSEALEVTSIITEDEQRGDVEDTSGSITARSETISVEDSDAQRLTLGHPPSAIGDKTPESVRRLRFKSRPSSSKESALRRAQEFAKAVYGNPSSAEASKGKEETKAEEAGAPNTDRSTQTLPPEGVDNDAEATSVDEVFHRINTYRNASIKNHAPGVSREGTVVLKRFSPVVDPSRKMIVRSQLLRRTPDSVRQTSTTTPPAVRPSSRTSSSSTE